MRWKVVRVEGAWTSLTDKAARWKKLTIQYLEEELDEPSTQGQD
jgi:hypothetical protein